MSRTTKIVLALTFAFLFRLGFGLAQPFWPEDQLQSYLIGLKSYTTNTWPYFGADLAGAETSHFNQIPGALEGLAIGLPFRVFPIPEAPFILQILFSTVAIALLTWYCAKRVPNLSPWFIFFTLVLLPWPLHESTQMISRAWCLFGSVIFFIGFFESLPNYRLGVVSPNLSQALMGFGLFWLAQFHMSWMYLAAFFALSILIQWLKSKSFPFRQILFFALGSIPMFLLIVPTLLKYGIPGGHSEGFITLFNLNNFKQFFTILARWLSFSCYETPYFLDPPGSPGFSDWGAAASPHWDTPSFLRWCIGGSTHNRVEFLMGSPFLLIPGLFLWIFGIAQAIYLLVVWFFRKHDLPDWPIVRNLAVFNLFIVWVSFWFTVKWPLAHIYYDSTFPMVFLLSLYGWSRLAQYPFWRTFAKVTLIAALIFQTTYAVRTWKAYSLYTDRPRIVKAIQEKNYQFVGERRPLAYY